MWSTCKPPLTTEIQIGGLDHHALSELNKCLGDKKECQILRFTLHSGIAKLSVMPGQATYPCNTHTDALVLHCQTTTFL